jgi:YfiH family protein
MKKQTIKGLFLWQFDQLGTEPKVRHFVTDRQSGGDEEPFTLSYSSHPDRNFIEHNRRKLAEAMDVSEERLFFPSQVHGTNIVSVAANTAKAELMDTDALITAETAVCIAVMSADCVPILLYDPRNRAVGAVHAGWRGTVNTILAKTVRAMRDKFNTDAKDLLAAIGPSICQNSYEVGEEVLAQVEKTFGRSSQLVVSTAPGKGKLDLWKANKIQLLEAGVIASNIEVSGLCTAQNNANFFSARRGDNGRFAAGIMLE